MIRDISVRVPSPSRMVPCVVFLSAVLAGLLGCGSSPLGTDAGTDGPKAEDAEIDRSSDARAHEAGTDGPRCCPRDPSSYGAGCVNLGGTESPAGCFTTCDFWCSTNWHVELNAQGCEFWAMDYRPPKPGENDRCFPDGGAGDAPTDLAAD